MRPLALLLVLASLAPAAESATARAQDPAPIASSRELQQARRVLDPRHRAGRSNADLVRELAGIGPQAASVLVGILTGVVSGTDWETSGLTLDESRAMQGEEQALLEDALRALPADTVALALTQTCAGTAPLDLRLAGLHLLAEVGAGAPAVACWHGIAAGIEELHLRRAYVRAQLESALAGCLERSAASFEPLHRELETWEPRLLPAVVHACGAAGRRAGVDVLAHLCARERALDLELLQVLPPLAEATCGALAEPELAWLRGFAQDEDAEVRSAALLGLGRACDPAMAPALLDALADSDTRVAQAARWSLQRVSGLDLPGGREEWESWLSGQSAWAESARARCVSDAESKDPALAVAALRELAQHPLYRHELARAIASACASEDSAVATAACAALRALGSMAGADALATLLAHPDETVRALAHETLVGLSGRKLGPEPEAWQGLLGS